MAKTTQIVTGGAELLESLRPLREKLLAHHGALTEHFRSEFSPDRIDKTGAELATCGQRGNLRVDLARANETGIYVGYCITRVNEDGTGEVFSIFVEEACRGQGIGRELVRRSLSWLESKNVQSTIAHVLVGNEEVLSFYEGFGFRPRTIVLKRSADSASHGSALPRRP